MPIKTFSLNNSAFTQLDSSGVNLLDTNHIKTELRASSIKVGNSTTIFSYRPITVLASVTGSPVPQPILPYNQFLLLNTGTTAITYIVGSTYQIIYNGNPYSRVTLNKQGQNVTLAIAKDTQTYYAVQTSGAVGFNNIVFS